MQEKSQSGDETFLMQIFKAKPILNMSLILIAVMYNVYSSPSTFKYAYTNKW